MAQNLRIGDEPQSMASLVGEIIRDAQKLLRQEVSLAKSEVQAEWSRVQSALISVVWAVVVAGIGGVSIALMAGYFLADATELPIWGCFAMVAVVFCSLGGVLVARAKRLLQEIAFFGRQNSVPNKEMSHVQ